MAYDKTRLKGITLDLIKKMTIFVVTTVLIVSIFGGNLIMLPVMATGNSTNSSSTNNTATSVPLHSTSVTITSIPSSVLPGGTVTFSATVLDTSTSLTPLTGSLSWSDGNAQGTFSSTTCILASASCTVSYTTYTNPVGSITITANYTGDSTHSGSSGTSSITISSLHTTTVSVTSNPSTISSGGSVTFTSTISDNSIPATTPTGSVSWSDGGAGGTFSSTTCILASASCTVSYTPSSNSPTVTITANYVGDSGHNTSSGTLPLTVNLLHTTTVSVTPNPTTLLTGKSLNFTVTVTDSSSSPTTPTSTVSWNDGIGGGVFTPSTCTLSSSASCIVSYTPSANPPNIITITANYNGDITHQTSNGTSKLSPNAIDSTITMVTPNPATFTSGTQVSFTATISDNSNPSSNIIGLVTWSDNGAGGAFSPNVCILTANHCALMYTPPTSVTNGITITATYAGDSTHSGSSGTSSLSLAVTNIPPTVQPQTTPPTVTPTPSTTSPPTVSPTPQTTPPTQSSTPPPSSQPSTPPTVTPTPQTTPPTQSSTPPPSSQPSTPPTQSNTPTNQPVNTGSSKSNPTSNALTTMGQEIKSIVSELESIFKKL